jgi:hypothetical protein
MHIYATSMSKKKKFIWKSLVQRMISCISGVIFNSTYFAMQDICPKFAFNFSFNHLQISLSSN